MSQFKVIFYIYFIIPAINVLPCSSSNVITNDLVGSGESKICRNIEIRSPTDKNIAHLKHCSVVEGFVRLAYFDVGNFPEVNLTFPNLREITDYLFLFRVSGLKSIGDIFPNLSVIRGNVLFENYALVVFESFHLEEIGLLSLTNILKGAVFIAKNHLLCYVDTIDWNLLCSAESKHYIAGNKALNECPLCPSNCLRPVSGKSFCWNDEHCQKTTCPNSCLSCQRDGECCHEHCLGGCFGPEANQCLSCKYLLAGDSCNLTCPYDTVQYLNRRCISENDCYNLHRSLIQYGKHWRTHNNKCLLDCPPGYYEQQKIINNVERYVCRKCENGKCRKECPAATINSIADAEKLKDCVIIKGALIINARVSGNINEELENYLRGIEEITEYLKIVDSFQLTSLNFLKNLKKIHGLKREQSKYSLVVIDNYNLELLWDWKNRKSSLQINGSLFFHLNPKLCFTRIEEILTKTEITDHSDSIIPTITNGEKAVCNITNLEIVSCQVSHHSAVIRWKQFEFHDLRRLVRYVISSKEAPFQNVTIYDGRYACGGGGWRIDDVPPSIREFTFNGLKPYTQYAFFVKTSTIEADLEAQTSLIYFQTLPFIPSEPVNLKATSKNLYSEISISWEKPIYPNGNQTHYTVSLYLMKDPEMLNTSCEKDEVVFENNNTFSGRSGQTVIDDNSYDNYFHMVLTDSEKERARQRSIDFEDQIQNQIYVKRLPTRKKRDSAEFPPLLVDSPSTEELVYEQLVYKTNIFVENLKHYSMYKIVVKACREWEKNESIEIGKNCGSGSEIMKRTNPLIDADSINNLYPSLEVSNKTLGTITLKWEEPLHPNGFIKYYIIQFRKGEDTPNSECISKYKYLLSGKTYKLTDLNPGNYSIRLRAESLKGAGPFTPYKYFVIENESLFSQYFYWILGTIGCFTPPALLVMFYYVHISGQKNKLIISVNPEYVASSYVPDSWEIPRLQVELVDEIGQGSFGMVYEGLLKKDGCAPKSCAVKTVNTQASDREKMEFLNEASVMKAFNTYHVVKLLGVVSQGEPAFVVMELMTKGDLKSYLRSCRADTASPVPPPTLQRLLQMAAEIADGMAYLSASKYVHRDLAARNCMVTDNLTVKIGDFGMARDIYEGDYYRKGSKGLMPVRWMSPESLRDGIFLTLSDVWSYGVVLYEMVTLAAQPYQGYTNDQALKYILDGGVIERPKNCPEKLYMLMRNCWRQNPEDRPTFLQLVSVLQEDVSLEFQVVSFFHSEEGRQLRRAAQSSQQFL